MLSLFVNSLTFDNKKNEILYSPLKIEWKKQVSTVSKKKCLLPEVFLNEKILSKIPVPASRQPMAPYVFAKFKYIPEDGKDLAIFLACLPNENPKIFTDLYYESHIPVSNQIIIVDGYVQKKNVIKNMQYLRVKGEVFAFSLDVKTYYLEEIILDDYIEFVQMENMEIYDEDEDADLDEDTDADDQEDNNDSSEAEAESAEEDADADADEDDDADEDADEDEDDDDTDVEDLDNEDLDDPDGKDDPDGEDDPDVEDDAEAEAEAEAEEAEGEALDDDENVGSGSGGGSGGGVDDVDDIDDEPPEPKPSQSSSKRKKPSSSKSIKFNAGIDTSVIFNILKMEDEKKPIPEFQLHLKRQINIKILKMLDLPIKTIQLIEKGIYNYAIEKCSANSIIPIWENVEFNDIYVSKSKSIYSNLNSKCYVGNKALLEKVKKGKINAYELAFMDSYKLYPEKWNDIIEEKAKMDKMLKESLKESATDLFQCVRCKKRKTIYCEVQTRSSDEPMTKFITCLECGYKWKQY
jgi:DNA-directed RNA polymerase subunit M/transcription elongation factor TFIIS